MLSMRRSLLLALPALGILNMLANPQSRAAENPVVVIETNKGQITAELYPDQAPATVENFLQYVDAGHYNNTIFHRVIGPNDRQPQGFMIQGGGFSNENPPAEKQTRAPVKNEAGSGLKNERGTLAMARTSDPDSATAQFFINLDDNDFLDRGSPRAVDRHGYTVFGKVIEGMDVVDAIARVNTGRLRLQSRGGGAQLSEDVPTEPVVIQSIQRKPAG